MTCCNIPLQNIASSKLPPNIWVVIGIDHDTVCAGVVGTAIRNSTQVPPVVAPAGTTSAVPDCSTNHDSADRISGQFLFYHDHNLQKVRENCVFDVLYRCSSPSAFALRRMTTGQLVTSQLVCDVTINRSRTTSAMTNLGFHSQSSLAM